MSLVFDYLLTISCSVSLLAILFVFVCYLIFKHLMRGLFPRIILYCIISIAIMTLGLLFSGPLSYFSQQVCYYSAVVRIFGQLSAILWNIVMMWVIKQLIQTQEDGSLIHHLSQIYTDLEHQECSLLIICYICPLIIVLWPLFSNDIIKSERDQYLFCYIYHSQSDTLLQTVIVVFQKIVIYDAAYIFYFLYSAIVLYKMKRVFYQTDHQINVDASKLVKDLIMFPAITFLCSFGYTIQEISSIFVPQGPLVVIIVVNLLMSLWGLFYSLRFASLEGIKDRLRGHKLSASSKSLMLWEEFQLTMIEQSDTDSYYYKDTKQDSVKMDVKYEEIIKMSQQNSTQTNKNVSSSIN